MRLVGPWALARNVTRSGACLYEELLVWDFKTQAAFRTTPRRHRGTPAAGYRKPSPEATGVKGATRQTPRSNTNNHGFIGTAMSTSRSIPPTHDQNVMGVVHQPGSQGLIHQSMAAPFLVHGHPTSPSPVSHLCSPCLRRLHRSRTLSGSQTTCHAEHYTPSYACLRPRWQHHRSAAGQPWFGVTIRSPRWLSSHECRNDGPPRKPWCFSGQFHHRQSHRGGWQRQCCRRGSFSSPARRDDGLQ